MTATEILAELQTALERLTLALMTGEPEAVLSAEAPVAAALQKLQSIDPASIPRSELAPRARAIRQAISSARRLGAASAHVQAAMLSLPYSRT